MTKRSKAAATSGSASPYGVHPSVRLMQNFVAGLPAKTGRSLEQWLKIAKTSGPPTEKELREWLKTAHALGTNTAWWIAERAFLKDPGQADDDPERYLALAPSYVAAQYAGKMSALKPLFDLLLARGKAVASDVTVCPCKTIVPLYRRHVFAEIKATTQTRVDLGLALGKYGKSVPARLVDTGGAKKKDRITHRIPVAAPGDVDAEVDRWLRIAYDLDES